MMGHYNYILGDLMSEVTDENMISCNIYDKDICNNTLIVSTSEYPSAGCVVMAGMGVYKVHFYKL